MSKKTAIIIGAGYGGMALANLLAKAGYSVEVFEKNETLGGRISEVHKKGFTFDLGPSWYLMPEVFEQYYSLFGHSAKNRLDIIRLSPGYRVFPESEKSLDIHGDHLVDQKTFEAIEKGAAEKFSAYIKKSKLVYEISIEHFLYNNFTKLRDVFNPVVIAKAPKLLSLTKKSLHGYVSSVFQSKVLQQLLEYHTVFLGGSPFKIPAVYSLMSHLDYESGVFYPKKGMGSLASDMELIGKEYGVTYRTSSAVSSITTNGTVATGVKLIDGTSYTADIVISNADLQFTETQLLPKQCQTYPEQYWKKREPGPSAFILSLGISGTIPELLHHNLYFVKDWQKNFQDIYETKKIPTNASMYVCNPTKTDPSLAPKGHENIFVLVPFPSGVSSTREQNEALSSKVIDILEKQLGIHNLRNRIVTQHLFAPEEFNKRYNAWANNAFGGESHLLSQSIIFRTKNKSKKLHNLYYVGAGTLPGIGLPMCLISAQLTFKKIAKLNTPGPLVEEDLL